MTDEEAFAKLTTELEKYEFRCALNLHLFAVLTILNFYDKKHQDDKSRIIASGVFASQYVTNLRFLSEILCKTKGRIVSKDEVIARWKKYYTRLIETGVRQPIVYDNGLKTDAPLEFEFFNGIALKCREGVLAIYREIQRAKEVRK